jgi:hypothetical protein
VFEYTSEEFEWRYGRQDEGANMNGHTLLVLEKKLGGGVKEKVAQLVRDEEVDGG